MEIYCGRFNEIIALKKNILIVISYHGGGGKREPGVSPGKFLDHTFLFRETPFLM